MKIVVNHLTRMQAPRICVAGLSDGGARHVRPLLTFGDLTQEHLRERGGCFELGAVIDLGATRAAGTPPEVEDVQCVETSLRHERRVSPREFWSMLNAIAVTRLRTAFGPPLVQYGRQAVTPQGQGCASLACFRPASAPTFAVDGYGKLRMALRDADLDIYPAVTDLRFYAPDGKTVRAALVRRIARQIADGERVLLSVGLTRHLAKPGEREMYHWLQVNNVHLEGDALGGWAASSV